MRDTTEMPLGVGTADRPRPANPRKVPSFAAGRTLPLTCTVRTLNLSEVFLCGISPRQGRVRVLSPGLVLMTSVAHPAERSGIL